MMLDQNKKMPPYDDTKSTTNPPESINITHYRNNIAVAMCCCRMYTVRCVSVSVTNRLGRLGGHNNVKSQVVNRVTVYLSILHEFRVTGTSSTL